MTEPLCVVIDDNPINALLLEQALVSRGCRTFALTDPLQAESIIADAGVAPALCIIDQYMPELPGHQLAAHLRARFGDACCYVAWSAAVLGEPERMAFDEVLDKPLNSASLDALLALLGLGHDAGPMATLTAAERRELLALFAQCTGDDLNHLGTALLSHNAQAAAHWLHKVEGSRAMLGLPLPALVEVREAVADNHWDKATAALVRVQSELAMLGEGSR
ncbi:response regulator [Marinobacter hydrocarbonoclasticus]|nr:response regulator [Marinobacter nauticus]